MSTQESGDLPQLGSLAQSARIKELNTARNILIVIGILTIIVNAIQIPMARAQVHKALQDDLAKKQIVGFPQEVQLIEEIAVQFTYVVLGGTLALGVLFVVFGCLVKTYPVPITITSLVLYVLATLFFAVLNWQNFWETLALGFVLKIIIIVALAKAIQSALVYQKEKRFEQMELGHE